MYLPEFKGPIEGYVVNVLKRERWRIAETHDYEDAMHEAWCVFLRCAAKYPIIDTPEHFMALFKQAFRNELNDLSLKATKARALIPDHADDEAGTSRVTEAIGELENMGHLAVMLRQAPQEVLMVINLFVNAPAELLELATAAWAKSGRRKPEGNAMLARLLGVPPGTDLLGQVEQYFDQNQN